MSIVNMLKPNKKEEKMRLLVHHTCLYVDPANALVDAFVEALSLLDFSLTHVTADAVSDALTST